MDVMIREYECANCGRFQVIHQTENLNTHCGWCGDRVKFIEDIFGSAGRHLPVADEHIRKPDDE